MIETILLFVVSLLIVIVVHELGHFLVSKRVGIPVEEFGIGFPPRLYGRMWRGTLYSINALPVGAFVRSPDENNPSAEGSLASSPPWKRLLVYGAGPFANIVLAFVLFTSFFALPRAVILSDGLLVYSVEQDSPAQRADLLPGDVLLSADGESLQTWNDLQVRLSRVSLQQAVNLDVQRDDAVFSAEVQPHYSDTLGRNVIGITLGRNIVVQAEPGSLAAQAGAMHGDSVLGVNGRGVISQSDIDDALGSTSADELATITMLRGSTTYDIELTGSQLASESLGLDLKWAPDSRIELRGVSFASAVRSSASYIVAMPTLIVQSVPLMREDPSLAFVGPIGAGQLTVEAVQVFGLTNLIFIAGLISLGIALFNLIPIPPLDGGGIIVALVEVIRRGRRLSERAVRIAYAVGTSLLITLVILITTSDLLRLLQGRGFGL